MTGFSLFRTSVSKVSSVTALVAPTCDHILNCCCCLCWLLRVVLAGQPAFGVDGGRAARPGRGYGLPVGAVHDVTAGEHALNGRARRRLADLQVSIRVGGQLAREQVRPRVVTD